MRRLVAALALALAWGSPATPAVLLVAGDDSIPVFANAVDYLHDLIDGVPDTGSVETVFVRGRDGPAPAESARTILRRIAALAPGAGTCLVFMTSHGQHGAGFYLASGEPLRPSDLDRALGQGCQAAPTVLIVSSCFAGQFITGPMSRPNRIILTAARADRTSFGCQAAETFTIFDRCLLAALPRAGDWHVVFDRARHCVGAAERRLHATPSEPQAWFGADVEHLATPFAGRAGDDGIAFRPSGRRFDPGGETGPAGREFAAYARAPEPKALARGPEGELVWYAGAAGETIEDTARLALESCELLTSMACALIAENDRLNGRLPSGLTPFHPLLLPRDGLLSATRAPFLSAASRPVIERYLAAPGPKALAIDLKTKSLAEAAGADLQAARAAALATCRGRSATCAIEAENDRIALGWPGE